MDRADQCQQGTGTTRGKSRRRGHDRVTCRSKQIGKSSTQTEWSNNLRLRSFALSGTERRCLSGDWGCVAEGVLVIPMTHRDRTTNLRTTFGKIVTRANVEPWGKPFQNLRSSRETELTETYAIHRVTAWMGNTPKVAMARYLQAETRTLNGRPRRRAFRCSTRPQRMETLRNHRTPSTNKPLFLQGFAGRCERMRNQSIARPGFEPGQTEPKSEKG